MIAGHPDGMSFQVPAVPSLNADRVPPLVQALMHGGEVKGLVQECAALLSSVNRSMRAALAGGNAPLGIEGIQEQIGTLESRVEAASKRLAIMSRTLEREVRQRKLLDCQLAAVEEQKEAARHAAFHDVLTGLPNRALFHDRLEHGLALARRHDRAMAVMFVDLDDFKMINDSYGHEAGDVVLKTIAQRLRDDTREGDTVSRLGGDEFLLLLNGIQDEKSIAFTATKFISTIQMPCSLATAGAKVSLSIRASIGISIFPKDGETAEALIKSADSAMYRAKQERSGYSFSL